jgi:nucleoside-diphosphate-sugar epimerase
MAERRTAIVAGAFGAVGRTLVEHLEALGGWEVVGIGRRGVAPTARARYLRLDLTDPGACARAEGDLPAADVVFFTAYAPRPSLAEELAPNLAMLSNLMEAVEPRSPALRRVVLLQGSKWYGSHLGPYKTPAGEDDPRLPVPHFYYAQQDWLEERRRGRDWSWSALRPHAVLGFATGSAMSLLNVLGVYGAICRELGRPMDFPGKPGAFTALYQMTGARLLARALVWAATAPACADRASCALVPPLAADRRHPRRGAGARADRAAGGGDGGQGAALAGDGPAPRAAAARPGRAGASAISCSTRTTTTSPI